MSSILVLCCFHLLLGVELISTLLGKVLLGYKLESNSRHFRTHLPANITRDRPTCSPRPHITLSSTVIVFEHFGQGRCPIPHLTINSIDHHHPIEPRSMASPCHLMMKPGANTGTTYLRVVTVGIIRLSGCKYGCKTIQITTSSAVAASIS